MEGVRQMFGHHPLASAFRVLERFWPLIFRCPIFLWSTNALFVVVFCWHLQKDLLRQLHRRGVVAHAPRIVTIPRKGHSMVESRVRY